MFVPAVSTHRLPPGIPRLTFTLIPEVFSAAFRASVTSVLGTVQSDRVGVRILESSSAPISRASSSLTSLKAEPRGPNQMSHHPGPSIQPILTERRALLVLPLDSPSVFPPSACIKHVVTWRSDCSPGFLLVVSLCP